MWNAERLLSKKVSSILFEPNKRYKRTIWWIFKVSKKLGYEKEDSWQSTKIENARLRFFQTILKSETQIIND